MQGGKSKTTPFPKSQLQMVSLVLSKDLAQLHLSHSPPMCDVIDCVPPCFINFLYISAIDCALNCSIMFSSFMYVSKDMHTRQNIGLGLENGCGIYEFASNI